VVDIVHRANTTWLRGEPGERLWVIDEITGVQGPWPEHVKRLRDGDAHFSADTVILTGSSSARFASEFGAGSPPDMSAVSEQQIAVALLRVLEAESPGAAVRHDSLLYYRSRTRAEIDFVGPTFAKTCVESKFVDRGWGRAFQTIEASGRRAGVVATRSGTRRHAGGWALPAGLVAYLIGS
jgi:hypothetical protein